MLAVARTALSLSSPEQGFTVTELYLRVTCGAAALLLEKRRQRQIRKD